MIRSQPFYLVSFLGYIVGFGALGGMLPAKFAGPIILCLVSLHALLATTIIRLRDETRSLKRNIERLEGRVEALDRTTAKAMQAD